MKKIILLLTVFTMVFTSCEPLEDIYSELDALKTDGIFGNITRTLSDDDYSDLDLSFGNFSSIDDAKTKLPAFISDKYPALGVIWNADGSIKKASSATITYKLYSPISKTDYTVTSEDYTAFGSNDLTTPTQFNDFLSSKFSKPNGSIINLTYNTLVPQIEYTLTDADFSLVGNGSFNNFDIRSGGAEETVEARRAKIETILLANFPAAVAGDQYFVTYAIYDGAPGTRNMLLENNGTGYDLIGATLISKTSKFVYTGRWAAPITFTPAEYTLMGQRFSSFDDSSEAQRIIGIYLRTLYPFAAADDFVAVEYDYYSGSLSQRNVNFVFDGSVWNVIPTVIDNVLQFAHDGTTWVPDNTIRYTLTNADFALVGNGSFNNFDVRAGKDEETVEARRVKINTILLNNFPQYGEGQKFSVSYAVWKPGDDIFVMNLIHDGSEYVLQ